MVASSFPHACCFLQNLIEFGTFPTRTIGRKKRVRQQSRATEQGRIAVGRRRSSGARWHVDRAVRQAVEKRTRAEAAGFFMTRTREHTKTRVRVYAGFRLSLAR